MGVVQTLVISALVGAAGSARAGVGMTELALGRAPSLLALGARATVAMGPGAARAHAAFRDELLTLFDDVAEVAWREARAARLELGARTIPAEAGGSRRRHRVKR